MSEVQKPVEEPVVAPTTAETPAVPVEESKATEEPATTTDTPAVETATETPAAEPAAEEAAAPAEEAIEEVKPVEEGVLGYKGPGLLKSFIFQKKFFWFGTEPVEQKSLASYLRGEKPEFANHNVAWAAHTGKGLLFFSKKQAEKTPAGIINLADAKDLTEDGTVEFTFSIAGHKHTFQAATLAERDNWVTQLKAKIAEAVDAAPAVKESEEYKSTHASLAKPVVATVAPVKKEEDKKEEKAEDKADKKDEKIEEKKEKADRKSRSASRKRTSIFGAIFPKKEEEKKEEVAPAVPAVPSTEAAPVESTTEETVASPAEPVAETPAVEAPAAEAPAATEPSPDTKTEEKPKPTKRASIFGTLSFKKEKKAEEKKPEEKKVEAEAPAVPAKDEPAATEPVVESAPTSEVTEPAAETPAEAPAAAPVEAETPPANKRKSTLPFSFGKKEKVASEEETEKPKSPSPFAKLRQTVRGKKAEKDAEKVPESSIPETKAEEKETPAAADPEVVSEPSPAATTSAPQVAATA